MPPREPSADAPLTDAEVAHLFRPLELRRLALAVSGGVDSMVLMHLVAHWLARSAVAKSREDALWRAEFSARTSSGRDRPVGCPRIPPSLSATADWIGADRSADAVLKAIERNWVVVLTVDHGLRPESAAEAGLVAEQAQRLGLPHQILRWTRPHPETDDDGPTGPEAAAATGSKRNDLLRRLLRWLGLETDEDPVPSLRAAMLAPLAGLQEKARGARFALLADAIEAESWVEFAHGFSRPFWSGSHKRMIVMAHHRDDLVETFLMRLKRGAGIDGLSSIRTKSTMLRPPDQSRPYPSVVDVCRPLLDVPKSRLIATAKRLGISWREDPSNRSAHFERVRTRNEMDTLARLGFEPRALHVSIRRLQRAREVVELHQRRQMFHWRDKGLALDEHAGLYCEFAPNPGVDGDEFSALVNASSDIVVRMLRYALQAFGGGTLEPELSQIEALQRHLDDCWRGGCRRSGGDLSTPQARRDFAARSARTLAGCRIDLRPMGNVQRDCIRVWREQGRAPLPELMLEPGDGGWWDNRFAISVAPEAPGPVSIRALGVQGWAMLKRRVPALMLWRDVPPGAFATLPAVWRGGELVTVPYFEHLPRSVPLWLKVDINHEWEAFNGLTAKLYVAEFRPVVDV